MRVLYRFFCAKYFFHVSLQIKRVIILSKGKVIKITIYIDVIFLENIIMNSIILYATAIILKIKPKIIRIIISSIVGSIYAVITYITELTVYTSIISKSILAVVMVYIAFNSPRMKEMGKQVVIFYLTSFVFGGVTLYLVYFIKPQEIFLKNGLFVGEYVLKVIFLGAIMAFAIIKISFKFIKFKINSKDIYCKINVKINKKQIETIAMIDTGNLAKEPITNTPVVIVESSILHNSIPKSIIDNIDNILAGNLDLVPEEYIPRLRCIPFSSLGKNNGMLLGIKADEIIVEKEETKITRNVIIGIYNQSLTKRGEYRALIGLELI